MLWCCSDGVWVGCVRVTVLVWTGACAGKDRAREGREGEVVEV